MRVTGMAQSYASSWMAQRLMANRSSSTSRTGSAYGTSRTGSTYGTSRTGSAYGVNRTGYGYGTSRTGSAYSTGRTSTLAAAAKLDQRYEDTKTAAQNVRTHANVLMNSGERTGKEVKTDARNFVNDYNAMVEQMTSTGGANNLIYRSQLNTSLASHKDDLAAVGIKAGRDGLLTLDEKTLAGADAAAVQKAFGGTGSFVGEASVRSIYVEADAVSAQASARYSNFGGYGSYGSYGSLGSYIPYSRYSSPYGSLGSYNMIGNLFSSFF